MFAELDWVPANLLQAEDRAHRIGQQQSVVVQYPAFGGSLGEAVARAIDRKAAIAGLALEGEARAIIADAERIAA